MRESGKNGDGVDSSIAELKTEFLAAQSSLSEQISRANESLGRLVWILSNDRKRAAGGNGDQSAEQKPDEAAASAPPKTGSSEAGLIGEIERLRDENAWLETANREMCERLVSTRTENRLNAAHLARANEEVTQLSNELAAHDRELARLTREVESVKRELEEAREAVKRLSGEVAYERRMNTHLRTNLTAAEAKTVSRDRQQRIVLEMLNGNGHPRKIGEILLSADIITRQQLDEVLAEKQSAPERLVGSILVDKGLADEEEVAQSVACQLKLPLVNPNESTLNPSAARLADRQTCERHTCIPLRSTSKGVYLAMADPRNEEAIESFEKTCQRPVMPLVATPTDINHAIASVFGTH